MEKHVNLVFRILRDFGLPHSSDEVLKFLLKHPYKGSLKSIEQALKHFNIDCSLIKVTPEKHQLLQEFPTPFIAHIKEHENKLVLVKSFKNSNVTCYSGNDKMEKYNLEDFFLKLSGNILVPFRPKDIYRKKNFDHLKKSITKLSIFLFLLCYLIYSVFIFSNSPLISFLFLLKLIGFLLSLFLLHSEYNQDNTFIASTCQMIGGNCLEILKKTNNSSFFIFSWAELGCIYFMTGSFLIFLGYPAYKNIFYFLIFLNIPALCFIPYSFYYQRFVLNSWCYFCLSVLLIFVLEFLVIFSLRTSQIIPSISSFIAFFIILILSYLFIQTIRIGFKNNKINNNLLLDIGNSKYNPELVNKIIFNLNHISLPERISFKIFGNSDSPKNRIFVVLSPFCPPCRKAYRELERLMLDSRKEDIEVNIVFAVDTTAEKSSKSYNVCQEIASYFLQTIGEEYQFREILRHWFIKEKAISDYPDIHKSYSKTILEEADQILTNQRKWIKSNYINYTPAIIFNNYLLPRGYSVEDIEFML